MIATWHAGPLSRPGPAQANARSIAPRGGPLAMLAALLSLWVGGRVLAWEDPFAGQPLEAAAAAQAPAQDLADDQPALAPANGLADTSGPPKARFLPTGAMSYADPFRDPIWANGMGQGLWGQGHRVQGPWGYGGGQSPPFVRYVMVPPQLQAQPARGTYAQMRRGQGGTRNQTDYAGAEQSRGEAERFAQVAQPYFSPASAALMYQAFPHLRGIGSVSGEDVRLARAQDPIGAPGALPFGGPASKVARTGPNRWSFDAWAFLREGSDAAAVSQGRVPIYGASQVGGIAQWRVRPDSAFDPRLYARAYRALVAGGETELAAGASIRPIPSLPLRAAGEVRVTESPFSTDIRPAGYVITELPPFPLIEKLTGELYAGAGYVGGEAGTAFIDGQFALTRPVVNLQSTISRQMRLSVGAGAWGGAQRGANRLDLGPTMRLDMLLGRIPARVSVDWRERIAGDAAPDSGVAATVSASF